MLREDLIRIVNILRNNCYDEVSGNILREREIMDLMDFFDDNVSHSEGTNIVFAPTKFGLNEDATAEEIVDFALESE